MQPDLTYSVPTAYRGVYVPRGLEMTRRLGLA